MGAALSSLVPGSAAAFFFAILPQMSERGGRAPPHQPAMKLGFILRLAYPQDPAYLWVLRLAYPSARLPLALLTLRPVEEASVAGECSRLVAGLVAFAPACVFRAVAGPCKR